MEAPPSRVISRKQVLTIISRYFKFIKRVKVTVLDDMINQGLIEIVNKRQIRILKPEISKNIDSGLFLKIIESGERIKDYDKKFWDSIDAENENLREIIKSLQKGIMELKGKVSDLNTLLDKLTLKDEEETSDKQL